MEYLERSEIGYAVPEKHYLLKFQCCCAGEVCNVQIQEGKPQNSQFYYDSL
jgi:hypothetical protein